MLYSKHPLRIPFVRNVVCSLITFHTCFYPEVVVSCARQWSVFWVIKYGRQKKSKCQRRFNIHRVVCHLRELCRLFCVTFFVYWGFGENVWRAWLSLELMMRSWLKDEKSGKRDFGRHRIIYYALFRNRSSLLFRGFRIFFSLSISFFPFTYFFFSLRD